jgi:4-hydroxy-2-oxoheptanedioate aldolase
VKYENPVKDKLKAGEVVLGCFVAPPSPEFVEMIALAGFDFVLLDAEHGPIDPGTAYPMILAAEAHGVPAFARIGQQDKQVILKFLDLGIAGVMVPQVNTAAQAEAAIAATKYFPRGNRGIANSRSFEYGMRQSLSELAPVHNDRILTMIQFEHIDTVAEIDAILAVPDLDVLFIGPNDLAQSMGLAGFPGHADVTKIADDVIARAQARGIKLGTVASDIASFRAAADRGFDMIVANAPVLLAQAAQHLVQGFRQ